jgi:predicted XRE-type DNA-binding protein
MRNTKSLKIVNVTQWKHLFLIQVLCYFFKATFINLKLKYCKYKEVIKVLYGQEGVRQCLIQYCTNRGVKYVYIAKQLDLCKSTISHFIRNSRDMRKRNFDKLVVFLQKEGYLE